MDGELRVLMRVLRVVAMALCRYSVYFRGKWYGSEERVAVVSCRRVRMDRSTRAACSPGGMYGVLYRGSRGGQREKC